ncbi:MAG: hypothetical protein F9K18_03555 [Thermoanaerobaculia bacterium]|nr:MAG: hypothetical protein F9K18_03555 [Thermoanaerobaculia bacterium]
MRTTVTLDPEVADRLRREMQRTGRSFKATLNGALREGLARRRAAASAPPFVVEPRAMGIEYGLDDSHDGFVLARQLTPEQREELHRALPPGFLERDAEIHETATGLELAAHRRQADLVPFYVHKLTEGCVGCHSRHARTRFPAFARAPAPAAHAH